MSYVHALEGIVILLLLGGMLVFAWTAKTRVSANWKRTSYVRCLALHATGGGSRRIIGQAIFHAARREGIDVDFAM